MGSFFLRVIHIYPSVQHLKAAVHSQKTNQMALDPKKYVLCQQETEDVPSRFKVSFGDFYPPMFSILKQLKKTINRIICRIRAVRTGMIH